MIHKISLADCLEPAVPPEKVLTLGALDDTVFVSIEAVSGDSAAETMTEVAEISVSLPSLIEALLALSADVQREHLRPVERDGRSRETRLAGRRLTVAPVSPGTAVGALTTHLRYTPEAAPTEQPVTRSEPPEHP